MGELSIPPVIRICRFIREKWTYLEREIHNEIIFETPEI